MKRTLLLSRLCTTALLSSGVVLAAGCGGAGDQPAANAAQASTTGADPTTDARAPEVSVTGCLTANLDGRSYALTPTDMATTASERAMQMPVRETMTYELVGNVEDFRRHANMVVTARGREDASARREGDMEREDEAEQRPAAGMSATPTVETREEVNINVRRLQVNTVLTSGDPCPSIASQVNPSTLPQTPR